MKKLTLAVGILLGATVCQTTAAGSGKTNVESVYGSTQDNGSKWVTILMNSKELKVYSSYYYDELITAWNKAVEVKALIAKDPAKANQRFSAFSSATYSDAYQEHLDIVSEKYDLIMELKAEADPILADSIAQMSYLDKVKASTYYPQEYNKLHEEYSLLFAYVEGSEVDEDDNNYSIDEIKAEEQVFLAHAKKFEHKIILAKYLTPLQNKLDTLAAKGFKKKAAISFAKAEAEIATVSEVIKANPDDEAAIQKAIAEADFEVSHIANISNEVQLFSNVKDDQFEQVVLNFEANLLIISKALNGSDLRNEPLKEQSKLIVKAIKELRANQKDDSNATNTFKAQTKALNEQIEELQAQVGELTAINNSQYNAETQAINNLKALRSENKILKKELTDNKFQIKSMQIQLETYQQQLRENNQAPKSSTLKWSKVE